MLKKLLLAVPLGLLFFLVVIPILNKPAVHASTKCSGAENKINFTISPADPKPGDTIEVKINLLAGNNDYRISLIRKGLEDAPESVVNSRVEADVGGIFDPDPYTVEINTSSSSWKIFSKIHYFVEVKHRQLPTKYCGRVEFTAADAPPPEPPSNEAIDVGSLSSDKKTLLRITATNLTPNANYVFKLEGKWDTSGNHDWLEGPTNNQVHTASADGTIVVRDICENGEGFRDNCGEEFAAGTYIIRAKLFDAPMPGDGRIGDNWDAVKDTVASRAFFVAEDGGISDTPVEPEADIGEPSLAGDPQPAAQDAAEMFLSFGIGTGGGLAFLLMIFGAYRLIFAAGNPESVQQGREIITAAIAGLIVIIFAVFILRFLGYTILGLGGL
jgi:hypothetical protein